MFVSAFKIEKFTKLKDSVIDFHYTVVARVHNFMNSW